MKTGKGEPDWLKVARAEGRIIEGGVRLAETVLAGPKKKAKFGNRKTTVDGITFDSKKESERYIHLKTLEERGLVRAIRLQVRFPLEVNGLKVCVYVADFVYEERLIEDQWGEVIEDVKSDFTRKNPVYRIKKKLMQAVHGKTIRES